MLRVQSRSAGRLVTRISTRKCAACVGSMGLSRCNMRGVDALVVCCQRDIKKVPGSRALCTQEAASPAGFFLPRFPGLKKDSIFRRSVGYRTVSSACVRRYCSRHCRRQVSSAPYAATAAASAASTLAMRASKAAIFSRSSGPRFAISASSKVTLLCVENPRQRATAAFHERHSGRCRGDRRRCRCSPTVVHFRPR